MHALADSLRSSGHSTLARFGSQLACRNRRMLEDDFAGCVVSALEQVRGTLLFQMRIDTLPASRRVAAISVGCGKAREFALVILADGAEFVSVELADESTDPLAAIAPAYAGMIDVLDEVA